MSPNTVVLSLDSILGALTSEVRGTPYRAVVDGRHPTPMGLGIVGADNALVLAPFTLNLNSFKFKCTTHYSCVRLVRKFINLVAKCVGIAQMETKAMAVF